MNPNPLPPLLRILNSWDVCSHISRLSCFDYLLRCNNILKFVCYCIRKIELVLFMLYALAMMNIMLKLHDKLV